VVPPDELERLYEPFKRLGGDRTAGADGDRGLGLSIVRAIASAHDATVTARPQPDSGLEVAVSFLGVDSVTSAFVAEQRPSDDHGCPGAINSRNGPKLPDARGPWSVRAV
jgi:hypothetical protein